MTKLLFIHDGPIYYNNDGQHYEFAYHGLLERYKYLADDITFLMRVEPVTEQTKCTLIPEEIHIIGVPNFKNPRRYFKLISQVKRQIEMAVKETDLLVLRGGSCSNIALKFAKKMNKAYIYECVGCTWDSLWNYSLLGKIMAPYMFLSERKRIKEAPFVCYVTKSFLQRRYPTQGENVACSNVVVDNVPDEVLTKRLSKINNYNAEIYKIGTAAAIDVRYKGQEYVIHAISELAKEGINFEYYLAGGNRLKSSYLKDLAEKLGVLNRMHFVGSLNSSQMPQFYDFIDIYIQPSKQEGLPRAVIEAMSRGVPCVGSNIAGIPELLQPECLFKKGNVNSIKNVLKKMIQNDMSRYAIENFNIAKEYQIDILTRRRNHFYDTFLESCRMK